MKLRMLISTVALLVVTQSHLRADDFSNNFAGVTQTSLDAFTKDFGAAMGGGSFHTGKALGFPIGFDIGVDVPVIGVKDEDSILKDDGSTLIGKWAHVEVGLPAKINLIGRVGKIEDANAYGGGLRVGLFSSAVPGIPSVSLSGLYGKATHDYFDATTISGNVCLSFEIPFIHPYIGAGVDRTKVDVNAHAGVPPASSNLDSSQTGYRVEAGVNLSLIPFTYITLGGGVANGEKMYHAGAGVKF
jgi:opacity protein-like surface antigen